MAEAALYLAPPAADLLGADSLPQEEEEAGGVLELARELQALQARMGEGALPQVRRGDGTYRWACSFV